ncbi:MAG: hypothetical protein DWQ02_06505 [Bacteroidetes bacterium]|nr:MAG: hypothetical protein DWQ02_06505 [Bacteroidota bacterium]
MQDHNTRAKLIHEKLKEEFAKLGLDPAEVVQYFTEDLDHLNRIYAGLLKFTQKYLEHQSKELMELTGDPFPPVFPGISPDSDWYRFERWVRGESVRETIKAQLPDSLTIKASSELTDDELPEAINSILKAMADKGFYVDLKDIPDRLFYEYVLDWIEEEHELCPGGGWHLDGCTGYCPGCIQRPWCDVGKSSVWPEDEDEGKMTLPEELKNYVSSSKYSLPIMLKEESENPRDYFNEEEDSFISEN